MIGKKVTVKIDRLMGSYHPKHKDIYYPINYGYVEGIMAPDGEEQDAYILGVDEAVETFTGALIAVVHRNDDIEEKWIVAPKGMTFSKEEIWEQIRFQEQYFDSEIVMQRSLNFAKQIAEENNCYKMMLLTGSKKESTLNFYRNAGYNSSDKTAFIQWIDIS